MTLAPDFQAIQKELNTAFPQRRDAVEGILLGLLTGQHSFLLGPPGTAKSLLTRSVISHFPGARYFETVLSKSRPDAAVLGPYDMNRLRADSSYVRKDGGYLTTVDFAFLDEIGKMSPTTGHDILAALNERIKHEVDNGRSAHKIPLRSVIGASNELPAAESEDAAALWDRLLIRVVVEYIKTAADFHAMLLGDAYTAQTLIPFDSFAEIDKQIAAINVPTGVLDLLLDLRSTMNGEGFIVSDRRWRDSLAVIRASAWLGGQDGATAEDLLVLRFTLWDDVATIGKISRIISGKVSPTSEKVAALEDLLVELGAQLAAMKGKATGDVFTFLTGELGPKIKDVKKQANALIATESSPRVLSMIGQVLETADDLQSQGRAMTNIASLET